MCIWLYVCMYVWVHVCSNSKSLQCKYHLPTLTFCKVPKFTLGNGCLQCSQSPCVRCQTATLARADSILVNSYVCSSLVLRSYWWYVTCFLQIFLYHTDPIGMQNQIHQAAKLNTLSFLIGHFLSGEHWIHSESEHRWVQDDSNTLNIKETVNLLGIMNSKYQKHVVKTILKDYT